MWEKRVYLEERESLKNAIEAFIQEEKLKRWRQEARDRLEESIRAYEEEYGETYDRSE